MTTATPATDTDSRVLGTAPRWWVGQPTGFRGIALLTSAASGAMLINSPAWSAAPDWPAGYGSAFLPIFYVSYGLIVASSTAPVIALARPRAAAIVAALGLASMVISPSPHVVLFATFVAFVGVAMSAAASSVALALKLAVVSLSVPMIMSWGWPTVVLHLPGNEISSEAWSLEKRLEIVLLYGLGAAIATGYALALRRVHLADLAVTAVVGERRQVANASAVVTERSRLARDLHDVVAHRISLIAVRAESAPYLYPELDPDARAVLIQVAADARAALDEMRGVLAVLHRSDPASPRMPQPRLADIDGLIEQARAAGMEVRDERAPVTVSEGTGATAYRCVQEALTNARRHGFGTAHVVVAPRDPDELYMRIENDTDATRFDEGRGLSGMRERVRGLGGRMEVRAEGGRFVVEAWLPRHPGD